MKYRGVTIGWVCGLALAALWAAAEAEEILGQLLILVQEAHQS